MHSRPTQFERRRMYFVKYIFGYLFIEHIHNIYGLKVQLQFNYSIQYVHII